MPVIRPSSDLRNKYNEISLIRHQAKSPVYITKNGAGDLAVMSIELYEYLTDNLQEPNIANKLITKIKKANN